MEFIARLYPDEEAQMIAFERLEHVFLKLDPSRRQLVRAFVGEHGEHPIVILGYDEGSIDRVKDGHWVGGEDYPLSNDVKAALEKQFLRTASTTPDDENSIVVDFYPAGYRLGEDGDIIEED